MTQELRLALRNEGKISPESIDDYIATGGFAALKKARQTERKGLIDTLESNGKLRGRGGAGFNTGLKWTGAYEAKGDKKYVVCNADEGEPGTYKDRTIIEGDPFTVLEGMLICAYAIGSDEGYIYCRGEYENCIRLLKNAIKQVEEKGINDGVKLHVQSGAGSYICGEETALLTSMEGNRGEPRLKPPFPTVAGLWGKPTVVNNVETFATVPVVVDKGAEWFSSIGTPKYPGTKIFSLSGDIQNKTCFELPTGTSLKTLIEEFGGSVPNGHKIKAIQVGGSSCGFLTPDQMDVSLDLESMNEIGASLGSGAVVVIDDTHNMVDILVQIADFFAHESCGKCTACREGSYRVAQIMHRIADGKGSDKDLEQLKDLNDYMIDSAFCPLGQSVTIGIMSAMKQFPEDFQEKFAKLEV